MEREERGSQSPEILDDLRIIRSMIEKAKQTTADNSVFLILWGWVVFVGSLTTYASVSLGRYGLIWVAWVTLVGLGVTTNVIVHRRHKTRLQVRTYIGNALQNLWIGCGMAMTIVGLVGSISPNMSYRPVFPIMCIITGIGVFATGGIVDWKPLRLGGVLWWAGAVVMMFVPVTYHPLIMAVIVVPGYLVPGYVLKAQYRRTSHYG